LVPTVCIAVTVTRFGSREREELTQALACRVASINDNSVANDIVDNDEAALARQSKCPPEIAWDIESIRIDVDEVVRRLIFQCRQRLERSTEAQVDAIGNTCAGNISERDLGMLGVRADLPIMPRSTLSKLASRKEDAVTDGGDGGIETQFCC
jgi:hypothetical protein